MDLQEGAEAAARGTTSQTWTPEISAKLTNAIEKPGPSRKSSEQAEEIQDIAPCPANAPANASAIELYLRPLITAFQRRRDVGTPTEDDVELNGLYTKWETEDRVLGDAVMDAASDTFGDAALDAGCKEQTRRTLADGGCEVRAAEVAFLRVLLEKFTGPEERKRDISREVERRSRMFDKGDAIAQGS